MARGRTANALGKAPNKGSNVESALNRFKAGWQPTSLEIFNEFFSGGSDAQRYARIGSLINSVRKWLRRERQCLFNANGIYFIPDEHNYHVGAKQAVDRLISRIPGPQEAVYFGMERFANNKELMRGLEMIDLSLVTGILNRRQQFLIEKNGNSNDPSVEDQA